ncbi:hypothetical protein ACHAW5_006313 [Stephanodiscus triporus]|uniref:Ubiquitin-like protease family profile domain-containing protein n=1 Tax=Stephanodiscus triporus TaxID=2934178 RepID=A0ABD3MEU1_9STRA
MSPSVPAKKRAAAASPLFEDYDTYNNAAPTIFSQATKRRRTGGNAKASGTGSSMSAANPPDMERKARDYAMKLMRPFTAEEQTVVEDALKDGPPKEILAKQGADSVQRGSMQTLCRGQWLNDEVINYFLKNCLMRRDEKMCTTDTSRRRSHFFNSFFIQTMFDEKSKDPELRGRYNFDNVKNWSKKVPGGDIFNLKYIVCPINIDDTHWTSAVIFMEDKRIQYYDSMGGTDWSKLEGLLKYVKDEYSAKNGKELDVTEWELVSCTSDTPRQKNGYDCGVFTCMFADFISKDCQLLFNQDHIDQCRQRIALSIMNYCAIDDSDSQRHSRPPLSNTLAAQAAVATSNNTLALALEDGNTSREAIANDTGNTTKEGEEWPARFRGHI